MKTQPLYLDGNFFVSEKSIPVTNPATREIIAHVSIIDRSRVSQAIRAAHEAFLEWRALTGKARGEFLLKIAGELEKRSAEIARTITLENGKPLAQSQGEIAMSIDHLRWFAEEARRAYGRIVPPQVDNKRHLVIKTPIGVVAAISPSNFPLVLAVRKT